MNHDDPQITKSLRRAAATVSLSRAERRAVRSRIVAFARRHPVREGEPERPGYQMTPKAFFSLFLKFRTMPIILIAALLMSGGVAFAAEGALPGDALYPVKVGVTEEVRKLVTFSPHAKAQWEAERVERRLSEALTLAEQGKLGESAQATLTGHLAIHAAAVATYVEAVQDSPDAATVTAAADLSADVETALVANEAILTQVAIDKQESAPEATAMALNLRTEAKKIGSAREVIENRILTDNKENRKEAAERQRKAARLRLEEASRLLEKYRKELKPEVLKEAERLLAYAKDLFAKGEDAFGRERYGDAVLLFAEANRVAEKLMLFLRAAVEHRVDVTALVTTTLPAPVVAPPAESSVAATEITIVPDIGSNLDIPVEKVERARAAAKEQIAKTERLLERYANQLSNTVVAAVKEQLRVARALFEKGEVAFTNRDYRVAYGYFMKALAIAQDAEAMIRAEIGKPTPTDSKPLPPPPTITPYEQPSAPMKEKAEQARKAAAAKIAEVRQKLQEKILRDPAVVAKVEALLKEAELVLAQGKIAFEHGDYREAYGLFMKALAIATEAQALFVNLSAQPVPRPVPIEPQPIPFPKPVPSPVPPTILPIEPVPSLNDGSRSNIGTNTNLNTVGR